MTTARWQGNSYELVNVTDNAEWVLRDGAGDVLVMDGDERVEVQCERCERWSRHSIEMASGRWVCADTECYDAERGEAS